MDGGGCHGYAAAGNEHAMLALGDWAFIPGVATYIYILNGRWTNVCVCMPPIQKAHALTQEKPSIHALRLAFTMTRLSPRSTPPLSAAPLVPAPRLMQGELELLGRSQRWPPALPPLLSHHATSVD